MKTPFMGNRLKSVRNPLTKENVVRGVGAGVLFLFGAGAMSMTIGVIGDRASGKKVDRYDFCKDQFPSVTTVNLPMQLCLDASVYNRLGVPGKPFDETVALGTPMTAVKDIRDAYRADADIKGETLGDFAYSDTTTGNIIGIAGPILVGVAASSAPFIIWRRNESEETAVSSAQIDSQLPLGTGGATSVVLTRL